MNAIKLVDGSYINAESFCEKCPQRTWCSKHKGGYLWLDGDLKVHCTILPVLFKHDIQKVTKEIQESLAERAVDEKEEGIKEMYKVFLKLTTL